MRHEQTARDARVDVTIALRDADPVETLRGEVVWPLELRITYFGGGNGLDGPLGTWKIIANTSWKNGRRGKPVREVGCWEFDSYGKGDVTPAWVHELRAHYAPAGLDRV